MLLNEIRPRITPGLNQVVFSLYFTGWTVTVRGGREIFLPGRRHRHAGPREVFGPPRRRLLAGVVVTPMPLAAEGEQPKQKPKPSASVKRVAEPTQAAHSLPWVPMPGRLGLL
jgi:hypothetical protein